MDEHEADTQRLMRGKDQPPEGPVVYSVWRDASGVATWEVRHHHETTTGTYLTVAQGDAMSLQIASAAAQMAFQAYEDVVEHFWVHKRGSKDESA